MKRATQAEQREGADLRRALGLTAVLALLVLLRAWAQEAPRLGAEELGSPHLRLTPTDAPRFKAGRWIDSEGQALAPEVAP